MYSEPIELLKKLIATPSFSKEEDKTADLITEFLIAKGIKPNRHLNNVWVEVSANTPSNHVVLLNSHHDTVKPSEGWITDPYSPIESEGKLFGLGSNDAGASVVSMLAVFLYFYDKKLPFNLIYSATAEEEISGSNGLESILEKFGNIDLAIVGEPTQMQMAVAERGLIVLDCFVKGKAGHAANPGSENAIYLALPIIDWFRKLEFPEVSDFLGKVKTTVTQISAGKQHNMVPDLCHFVVDVRTNGLYTNKEVLEYITRNCGCEAQARSLKLNSSAVEMNHTVVTTAQKLGIPLYGSPTTSDQAIIPFPSVKIGPGDSSRSHTANEFIYPGEIEKAINIYIEILENLRFS